MVDSDFEEAEEMNMPSEPEIDLEMDPFQSELPTRPGKEWEQQVQRIEVRKPKALSAEEQKQRVRWIIETMNSEGAEPTEEQVAEALSWIRDMQSITPNHEEFIASNFQHCYPA
jgi:hypothetical protein